MIVWKSTHELMKEMYESRLTEMRARIEDLRSLVFSSSSASNIPLHSMEADAVLSGRDEVLLLHANEQAEEVISERDRLLSGQY